MRFFTGVGFLIRSGYAPARIRGIEDPTESARLVVDYYESPAIQSLSLEAVCGCAKALDIPMAELLGSEMETTEGKNEGPGPTAKMRRLFEAASQVPRGQQEKIAAVLDASQGESSRHSSRSELVYLIRRRGEMYTKTPCPLYAET